MSVMRWLVSFSLLVSLVALAPAPVQAQIQERPPRSCVSDWRCGGILAPLGFYVDSVTDEGRYITLEDGSIWEVQLDHRARAAGWNREVFVQIRPIHAPMGDYEWLFTKGSDRDWRVAVRLVGRVRR